MDKQQLITDNMTLVYYLVNKYYPTYTRDEDVIQEGMLGLCKAAEKFNSEKGKFSTFASICILNQLRDYFKENSKHYDVLSYNIDIKSEDCENITLLDTFVGEDDVELGCMNFRLFYDRLNESEQKLIDLLVCHTETETAEILGVSIPLISRRKKMIRTKWRKFNARD